jgi:hypothetical protein
MFQCPEDVIAFGLLVLGGLFAVLSVTLALVALGVV